MHVPEYSCLEPKKNNNYLSLVAHAGNYIIGAIIFVCCCCCCSYLFVCFLSYLLFKSETSIKSQANRIVNKLLGIIISLQWVIIASYDVILHQPEHAHPCNHLSK